MRIGLFCVHGFLEDAASSFEYFKERLLAEGIEHFVIPDLQGHSLEEDIETFNHKLCLEQVEEQYKEFEKEYEVRYILGFSMGGVIASHLASHFSCDKLVLVSPAFKYGNQYQVFKDVQNMVRLASKSVEFPSLKELLQFDTETRKQVIQHYVNGEFEDRGSSYINFLDRLGKMKPKVYLNFTRLVARVKKDLSFKDPTLKVRIYQAEQDELVPVASSLYILHKFVSRDKRLTVLSGVRHRILSAPAVREEVVDEIIKFLYKNNG